MSLRLVRPIADESARSRLLCPRPVAQTNPVNVRQLFTQHHRSHQIIAKDFDSQGSDSSQNSRSHASRPQPFFTFHVYPNSAAGAGAVYVHDSHTSHHEKWLNANKREDVDLRKFALQFSNGKKKLKVCGSLTKKPSRYRAIYYLVSSVREISGVSTAVSLSIA